MVNRREGKGQDMGISASQAGAVKAEQMIAGLVDACGIGRVLELGCGSAGLVPMLLNRGIDAVGVRDCDASVEAANQAYPGRFRRGSVFTIPFENEAFKTAIVIDCLNDLSAESVVQALNELRRVTASYIWLEVTTSTHRDRAWWESCSFTAGFRKHPLYYLANPYEALNQDGEKIHILLEKVGDAALSTFDLTALVEERLLHTDMLRETGRRSDAHCIRYYRAAEYIRPGDRVLDVACGLGYGSHIMYAASEARSVLGVDLSDFGVAYANAHYGCSDSIAFRCGDAQALEFISDGSIDFVAAFETIEHVPDPVAYLRELKRVLKPGGRVMVCAPNDWTDETGRDPNPHHLHVYTWDRLVQECGAQFLLEQGFLQTAGGAMKCHHSPRKWVSVSPDAVPQEESEWVLLLCMADPLDARHASYMETAWSLPSSPEFHVAAFARDYANPWLVKGMVTIGTRIRSEPALASMRQQVLAHYPAHSVDFGAALCGQVYEALATPRLSLQAQRELEAQIHRYAAIPNPSPHQLRWQVSLLYAGGQLAMRYGRFDDAAGLFTACASQDVARFSPLLGNKVLDALFQLASFAIARGDEDAARTHLVRSVELARRLVSGSWLNISGDPEQPLPFGLAEAAQLMDKAARAAYMLSVLPHGARRPGVVHQQCSGFFERQLMRAQGRVNDLSEAVDRLAAEVVRQDASAQSLAKELRDCLAAQATQARAAQAAADAQSRCAANQTAHEPVGTPAAQTVGTPTFLEVPSRLGERTAKHHPNNDPVSPSDTRVGIVIVSYNASDAVRLTLASLRRARTDVPFELLLVDNASEAPERARIREAMSRHMAEVGGTWRYVEQEHNLGFSGGNNVGISQFLSDDAITHICLLNSDVIVTDHWLDRLVGTGCDLVSAVTNRADGEQWIPIDYAVELEECLDATADRVHEKSYSRVNKFAQRWHQAWRGNLVECDVTFFCVLLRASACREIGLLDEAFFPGGFEDDDYCLRARKAGFQVHLARDTYLHHWGSASFGRLQYEYFSERAERNKRYLEDKHQIKWRRRTEMPLVSFASDLSFALSGQLGSERTSLLGLYLHELRGQVEYYESEYRALRARLDTITEVPPVLREQVAAADAYGDLKDAWDRLVQDVRLAMRGDSGTTADATVLSANLRRIAAGIHDRVDCNFAIHGFLVNQPANAPVLPAPRAAPQRAKSRTTKLLQTLRRALSFAARFDGIVFFGGYFYPERQSDGYFQRIQMIDRLFTDRWRVYVESTELPGRERWFDRPEPKVLVLRITGSRKRRLFVRALALIAALRCRKVYFHSVLRMRDNGFGQLLRLPFLRKLVDLHGVVPEEFRMHNDFFSALLYEREEALAVYKAQLVVVVTNAMDAYLRQKYRDLLAAETACLPMFPSFAPELQSPPLVEGKPVVVYAGGLHKWQQVPKMVDAIARTVHLCAHRFYCTEPEVVRQMLPEVVAAQVDIDRKTHTELMQLYRACHYGFVLREDNVVNRVACPTKLVEYIAMGIVPIMDSDDVGDSRAAGLRYIELADFLGGRLPGEAQRLAMAQANLRIYEALRRQREVGSDAIHAFFTPQRDRVPVRQQLLGAARRALPPGSLAGRVARRLWRVVKPVAQSHAATHPVANPDHSSSADELRMLQPCDILVQVDNFESGGLENVVLDLNGVLTAAGHRVAVLVLGNRGASVQRAKELGQAVICRAWDPADYASLLGRLQPKLVLSHYSVRGVDICKRAGIPFVQVIHNIYMWFDEAQRQEFSRAAADTTVFVAVSDAVKAYSTGKLGVPAGRCVVIPNGIDVRAFQRANPRAARDGLRGRFSMTQDEFVFLDVGSINHQKNHLAVVKAFEIVAQTVEQARLLIIGPCYETELLRELQEYVEQHGLSGKVVYGGPATDVPDFMAMADAFVSGAFFEGCQLVLLEAIAANLPIATPEVGHAAHFSDRCGIHIVAPACDLMRYSGPIAQLHSDRAFEERLAGAMMRICREPKRPNFSSSELDGITKEHCYAKYVELIADLIGSRMHLAGGTFALEHA